MSPQHVRQKSLLPLFEFLSRNFDMDVVSRKLNKGRSLIKSYFMTLLALHIFLFGQYENLTHTK